MHKRKINFTKWIEDSDSFITSTVSQSIISHIYIKKFTPILFAQAKEKIEQITKKKVENEKAAKPEVKLNAFGNLAAVHKNKGFSYISFCK